MKTFTVMVYGLFGTMAIVAGLAALVMPSLALPAGASTGLTNHLVREEAAAFVFIGLMFIWCLRNYERRHSVHFPLLVFIVLFAGVHWMDYVRDRADIMSPLVNTIPVILLAVTAPFARAS
jgi:hypothetical protein